MVSAKNVQVTEESPSNEMSSPSNSPSGAQLSRKSSDFRLEDEPPDSVGKLPREIRAKTMQAFNPDEDVKEIAKLLREATELREKYAPCGDHAHLWLLRNGKAKPPKLTPTSFAVAPSGIYEVLDKDGKSLYPMPTLEEYYNDMERLFNIRNFGPVTSHCYYRLRMLRAKFELYYMVNYGEEVEEQRRTQHRDFYNVRKVDNHIHHAAAMNAKHLTRFMKKKFKKCSSDIVAKDEDDQDVTLAELAQESGFDWYTITINSLQMWTDRSCMHRFDRFNNKYMPMGQSRLRTLFLKTDNIMNGRYFAEITRELLDDLEEYKYQMTEWRLSIYGRKRNEWKKLAKWALGIDGHGSGMKLISPNNMWMIQIPRLYEVYKKTGQLENFGEMLDNIFMPMFDATMEPENHPEVAEFLSHIGAIDTVDDESKSGGPSDRNFSSRQRKPREWNVTANPSYKYYSYHIQVNLRVLNRLRAAKGLNQFKFRPHAGEAGEIHHLDTAFLLADSINHGINLKKNPTLQYLFYLCQIGLSMSPCSNNHLFLAYDKNPFYQFFQTGLNVTLSTDDPLMFHQTKEPLLEEYAIAKQLWKLSPPDLCEIARNSVWQCSYPMEVVLSWLGVKEPSEIYAKNSLMHSNVPESRFRFRRACLKEEWSTLRWDQELSLPKPKSGEWEELFLSPKARPPNKPHFMMETEEDDHNGTPAQVLMAHRGRSEMEKQSERTTVAVRHKEGSQTILKSQPLPLLAASSETESLHLSQHTSAQSGAMTNGSWETPGLGASVLGHFRSTQRGDDEEEHKKTIISALGIDIDDNAQEKKKLEFYNSTVLPICWTLGGALLAFVVMKFSQK